MFYKVFMCSDVSYYSIHCFCFEDFYKNINVEDGWEVEDVSYFAEIYLACLGFYYAFVALFVVGFFKFAKNAFALGFSFYVIRFYTFSSFCCFIYTYFYYFYIFYYYLD